MIILYWIQICNNDLKHLYWLSVTWHLWRVKSPKSCLPGKGRPPKLLGFLSCDRCNPFPIGDLCSVINCKKTRKKNVQPNPTTANLIVCFHATITTGALKLEAPVATIANCIRGRFLHDFSMQRAHAEAGKAWPPVAKLSSNVGGRKGQLSLEVSHRVKYRTSTDTGSDEPMHI